MVASGPIRNSGLSASRDHIPLSQDLTR
jgi:hypothetical protein